MAMTNEEKYLKWLKHGNEDLKSAEVMLSNGRYSYVAFMCQQAIEKLAKGIFV
jgi:HEPN domain-containing protein